LAAEPTNQREAATSSCSSCCCCCITLHYSLLALLMLRHLRVGLSSARLAISFVVSRSSFSRSLSAMATSTASDAAAAATTAAADEYITGSCNCGSLKYRAKLPPLYSGFCHCKVSCHCASVSSIQRRPFEA